MKEVFKSGKDAVAVVTHGAVCYAIGKEIIGKEIKLPQTEFRILEGTSLDDLKLVD